jgi:predicted nucleic acid-binding protein
VKAADSSVVIAAFASWHEHHERARAIMDQGVRLVEHCALETYSVLTRLPSPHRCSGIVVRDFLQARFAEPFLRLDATAWRRFLMDLPERELAGGAIYDALVAATAAQHDAELISCDRRAAAIYESYGIKATILA